MDDLTAFVEARLAEDNAGRHLDFTSYRALAAAWSDHPDCKQEWAPQGEPDGTPAATP